MKACTLNQALAIRMVDLPNEISAAFLLLAAAQSEANRSAGAVRGQYKVPIISRPVLLVATLRRAKRSAVQYSNQIKSHL